MQPSATPPIQRPSVLPTLILGGYLIWMVVLASVYFLLLSAGNKTLLPYVWGLIGLSGIAAILTGIKINKPTTKWPWLLFASANLAFISGDIYFKVSHYILNKENPYPSWADGLYLATYPLFAAGMVLLIRRRTGSNRSRGELIDALAFTAGLALLVAVYILLPNATASDPLPARIVSMAYPLGDVLVWAMLARILLLDAKTKAVRLLALGALGLVVADIAYAFGQFYGYWHEGNPFDLGWIIFYAAWGAAALHSSMGELTKPTDKVSDLTSPRRMALLAVTALVAPSVLFIESRRGHAADSAMLIAVGAATLFILAMLRMVILTRTIARRNAEIALARDKNEVIAIASHQLRTPMTIVKLYSESLINEPAGSDKAKSKQYVNVIHDANERMIDTVNRLLYSSELDLGTVDLKLEPTDIKKAILAAFEDTKPLLAKEKVTARLDIDDGLPQAMADPQALLTVLSYLLSNAAYYAQESNGTVRLSANVSGNEVAISFTDNGIGIPADEQHKIFTKLFRAANARTSYPDGSGISLYVAKLLIEKMNGRIWFESIEGHGTTFYIVLPLL